MRRIVVLFLVLICTSTVVSAQSFTDKLQKSAQGEGRVVVTESKDIDALVNGTKQTQAATPAPQVQKTKATESQTVRQHEQSGVKEDRKTAPHVETVAPHVAESASQTAKPHASATEEKAREEHAASTHRNTKENTEEETNSATTIVRKKVNRGWRRVKGYRVQAYSGSNTRQSRQMAEQAGNTIKAKFPDQPVYVHFYSPSWKCRVGNFRTYAEAERLMKQIRRMGYKSACVVAGTITVQPE